MGANMIPLKSYCDVCKAETQRCEYYPKGRSRQHGKCLECDKKDPTRPAGYRSSNPRYCYECARAYLAEKSEHR
jgi:hypothetical protein